MKILHICEAAAAGVGKHVTDLTVGLAERGLDVHLAYSRNRIDKRFENGITQLEQLGGTAHLMDLQRSVGMHDVASVKALRALIKKEGFQVVHGHSSKGGALARLAARGLGRDVYYTPNAYMTMSPTISSRARLIYGQLERILDRFTTITVNVSKNEQDHAVALGIPVAKTRVIYNAISGPKTLDRDAIRAEYGVKSDEFIYGFVGRFSDQKNPLLMLEAFAKIANSTPNARLLMVGDGELKDQVYAKVAELKLGDKIILPGGADGQTVMNAMDVFVLTSNYEGFPYVLLEASAAGLPIVSTDMGAANECVIQDKTGFLASPGDAAGLAAGLQKLYDDPSLKRRFSHAALDRSQAFLLDEMVKATEQLYFEQARK